MKKLFFFKLRPLNTLRKHKGELEDFWERESVCQRFPFPCFCLYKFVILKFSWKKVTTQLILYVADVAQTVV